MRIINVVTIRNGVVGEIESFIITNEKLTNEIAAKAEIYFMNKAFELGFNDESEDNDWILDQGYYEAKYDPEGTCVCISWSNINN